jgi:hypothetical protein
VARVYLVLALLAVTFWVYSIVDCALQPPTRHRGVSKPVWILIVVFLPVVGGVLWFAIGRSRGRQGAAMFRAPDDDPEFLGSIGVMTDQEDRIRRLEQELAALDSEGDDTTGGPTAEPDADADGTPGPRGTHS